ncbi:hypothetical protein Salat_0171200 [Sesamum alatum]|uniref:Uncharacterized protein n=1 Tax=Sesamum alatum TaxID=300844 RepID=A0AAE1YY02_9LAMI|nr:hypothetical protein Salat_0171200 [Sesamum alatum]
MNGYNRIKSSRAIEIESSDSCSVSSPHSSKRKSTPTHGSKTPHQPLSENGDQTTEKKSSPFAFRRNRSIAASTSMKLSNVKRALSLRRSSSVSERYCRIHDQHVALAPHPDDEEFEQGGGDGRSFSTEKKSGSFGRTKIMKSCKRLFGL